MNLDLLRYFDDVILSSEVGLRKPDLAIYQLALRNLSVPVDEAWFVDDLPENVRAANGVGIRGFWLRRDETFGVGTDLTTIRKLTDLTPSVRCG